MNTMQRINKIDMYYNDKTVESTMKSGIKYQYVCGANIIVNRNNTYWQ